MNMRFSCTGSDQYAMPSDKPDDACLTLDSVSDTQGRTVYFAIDAINRVHQVETCNPLSHSCLLQTEYFQDCEVQQPTNEPYRDTLRDYC